MAGESSRGLWHVPGVASVAYRAWVRKRVAFTDRILARLPGPRWVWTPVWIATPWLQPVAFTLGRHAAGDQVEIWQDVIEPRLLPLIVFSYAVGLSLFAARKFAQDVTRAEPLLVSIGDQDEPSEPIRGVDSTLVPLALSASIMLITAVVMTINYDLLTALTSAPIIFIVNLPTMAAFSGYIALLAGLDRLGRRRLALEHFPADRHLGLRPVGRLAFGGFAVFAAGLGPIIVANTREPIDLTVAVPVALLGTIAFFGSLVRLHNRMREAKERYLGVAHDLYAAAYAPIADQPTLQRLMEQAERLDAAEKLEKRAEAIYTWPFEPAVLTQIVVVITSVSASMAIRLLTSAG